MSPLKCFETNETTETEPFDERSKEELTLDLKMVKIKKDIACTQRKMRNLKFGMITDIT